MLQLRAELPRAGLQPAREAHAAQDVQVDRRAQGQPIAHSQFESDSTGRGVCPIDLEIGQSYTLDEIESKLVANVQLTDTALVIDRPNEQLQLVDLIVQPNTPYGG